jgi:hypothetical protein
VLGVLLTVTRQGWLSLLVAASMVPSPKLLALLCIVLLPVWLIVTDRPEMRIETSSSD